MSSFSRGLGLPEHAWLLLGGPVALALLRLARPGGCTYAAWPVSPPPLPLRRCLTQMGTAKESFVELTERIGRKTGGVSVSPFVSSVRGSPDPTAYIMASSALLRPALRCCALPCPAVLGALLCSASPHL